MTGNSGAKCNAVRIHHHHHASHVTSVRPAKSGRSPTPVAQDELILFKENYPKANGIRAKQERVKERKERK